MVPDPSVVFGVLLLAADTESIVSLYEYTLHRLSFLREIFRPAVEQRSTNCDCLIVCIHPHNLLDRTLYESISQRTVQSDTPDAMPEMFETR